MENKISLLEPFSGTYVPKILLRRKQIDQLSEQISSEPHSKKMTKFEEKLSFKSLVQYMSHYKCIAKPVRRLQNPEFPYIYIDKGAIEDNDTFVLFKHPYKLRGIQSFQQIIKPLDFDLELNSIGEFQSLSVVSYSETWIYSQLCLLISRRKKCWVTFILPRWVDRIKVEEDVQFQSSFLIPKLQEFVSKHFTLDFLSPNITIKEPLMPDIVDFRKLVDEIDIENQGNENFQDDNIKCAQKQQRALHEILLQIQGKFDRKQYWFYPSSSESDSFSDLLSKFNDLKTKDNQLGDKNVGTPKTISLPKQQKIQSNRDDRKAFIHQKARQGKEVSAKNPQSIINTGSSDLKKGFCKHISDIEQQHQLSIEGLFYYFALTDFYDENILNYERVLFHIIWQARPFTSNFANKYFRDGKNNHFPKLGEAIKLQNDEPISIIDSILQDCDQNATKVKEQLINLQNLLKIKEQEQNQESINQELQNLQEIFQAYAVEQINPMCYYWWKVKKISKENRSNFWKDTAQQTQNSIWKKFSLSLDDLKDASKINDLFEDFTIKSGFLAVFEELFEKKTFTTSYHFICQKNKNKIDLNLFQELGELLFEEDGYLVSQRIFEIQWENIKQIEDLIHINKNSRKEIDYQIGKMFQNIKVSSRQDVKIDQYSFGYTAQNTNIAVADLKFEFKKISNEGKIIIIDVPLEQEYTYYCEELSQNFVQEIIEDKAQSPKLVQTHHSVPPILGYIYQNYQKISREVVNRLGKALEKNQKYEMKIVLNLFSIRNLCSHCFEFFDTQKSKIYDSFFTIISSFNPSIVSAEQSQKGIYTEYSFSMPYQHDESVSEEQQSLFKNIFNLPYFEKLITTESQYQGRTIFYSYFYTRNIQKSDKQKEDDEGNKSNDGVSEDKTRTSHVSEDEQQQICNKELNAKILDLSMQLRKYFDRL